MRIIAISVFIFSTVVFSQTFAAAESGNCGDTKACQNNLNAKTELIKQQTKSGRDDTKKCDAAETKYKDLFSDKDLKSGCASVSATVGMSCLEKLDTCVDVEEDLGEEGYDNSEAYEECGAFAASKYEGHKEERKDYKDDVKTAEDSVSELKQSYQDATSEIGAAQDELKQLEEDVRIKIDDETKNIIDAKLEIAQEAKTRALQYENELNTFRQRLSILEDSGGPEFIDRKLEIMEECKAQALSDEAIRVNKIATDRANGTNNFRGSYDAYVSGAAKGSSSAKERYITTTQATRCISRRMKSEYLRKRIEITDTKSQIVARIKILNQMAIQNSNITRVNKAIEDMVKRELSLAKKAARPFAATIKNTTTKRLMLQNDLSRKETELEGYEEAFRIADTNYNAANRFKKKSDEDAWEKLQSIGDLRRLARDMVTSCCVKDPAGPASNHTTLCGKNNDKTTTQATDDLLKQGSNN